MILEAFRQPVGMTDAGSQAKLLEGLPRDVGALAKVVQGLLMHEHIAPAYGLTLSAAQHEEAHTRPVEEMLKGIVTSDPRPLAATRPPANRRVGVCRHFTLLHVAMLRAQGVAARARCGFAGYFTKDRYLDHWVSEHWNENARRWVLVDPQLDERQRGLFAIDFDPLDVPRDRFLVAGDAWRACRNGKADPEAFGILDLHGMWFIAANIVRDVAALNNREMLPWDCWGAMPRPDSELDLAFFDRLAKLTHEPDQHLDTLATQYRDDRLAVPGTVLNAVLDRPQNV